MGGAGGYTEAVISLPSNPSNYTVVVGEGGSWGYITSAPATYGFGGGFSSLNGGSSFRDIAGNGGGLSGVFINSVNQSNALIVAGGGGGGGDGVPGPAHGYGANGNSPSSGGQASMNGQDGDLVDLGVGGGGGGFFGGSSAFDPYPGESSLTGFGGSGYVTAGVLEANILFTSDGFFEVPNSLDPDYQTGVGEGGQAPLPPLAPGTIIKPGGDGLVVIQECFLD
jgi:hypothetical protein